MAPRTLSAQNPRVVRLGRLASRRRTRDAERIVVLDGPLLVAEALDVGLALTEVFVDNERLDEAMIELVMRAEEAGADIYGVTGDVLRKVTDPVHPQPMAALARRPECDSASLAGAGSVLVLVGVADPGNAGTLVRAAVAAGFDAVGVTAGTVELFGPKALRAAAGTTFHVPIVDLGPVTDVLPGLHDAGLTTVATRMTAADSYDEVDLVARCAVLVGNEAHGLDDDLLEGADRVVRIPMAGPAESLNVAMAGTLLCFEVLRQRRLAGFGVDSASPAVESSGAR